MAATHSLGFDILLAQMGASIEVSNQRNSDNMEFIELKVTSKVIQQSIVSDSQEQIAIVQVPDKHRALFGSLNRKNPQRIRIGSVLELNVGDTNAIWGAHNGNEDFRNLYSFLSKYPDKAFCFALEVV